eukprot:313090_1
MFVLYTIKLFEDGEHKEDLDIIEMERVMYSRGALDFVIVRDTNEKGELVEVVDSDRDTKDDYISHQIIDDGERIFHLRRMMSYGSSLGDGSERGVDYAADALHEMAVGMTKFYKKKLDTSKKVTPHELIA